MRLTGFGFSSSLFIFTKKTNNFSSFFFNDPGENVKDCCGTLQLVPSRGQFSKTRSQSPEKQVPAACAGCASMVVPAGRASPLHGRGEEPQQDGQRDGPGTCASWMPGACSEREHFPHLPKHLDSPRRMLLQLFSFSHGRRASPAGTGAAGPLPSSSCSAVSYHPPFSSLLFSLSLLLFLFPP